MLKKENFELVPCDVHIDKTPEELDRDGKAHVFGPAFVCRQKTVNGMCLTILNSYGEKKTTFPGAREENWQTWLRESDDRAIAVHNDEKVGRYYWLVKRAIYSETEKLDANSVWAMVLQKEKAKERKLKRAFAVIGIGEQENAREVIPEDVRIFVWRRDGGKCTKCGCTTHLEFDHLIPLAMGGSNTARNLQLLCADCNRAKGPYLV